MLCRRRREPQQRAEAPRVPESKRDARVEHQVEMVVRGARRHAGESAQASRHPEMKQERVFTEPKKQVLASPVEPVDRSSGDGLFDRRGNRPAEPPVVDS